MSIYATAGCLPCQAQARLGQSVPQEILRAHALEHRAMRRGGVRGRLGAVPTFASSPYFWTLMGAGVLFAGALYYFGVRQR